MNTDLPKRFTSDFLTCAYDPANHWIYGDWKGRQTLESSQAGAEAILALVQRHQSVYLLNDNRRVLGMWDPAMQWTITDWAPRLVANGLTHLAHVVQPDSMAAISAKTLKQGLSKLLHIEVFEDKEPAEAWLRKAQQAARL